MGRELELKKNIIIETDIKKNRKFYLKHLFVIVKLKQEISDCCLDKYDLKIAPFQKRRDRDLKYLQRVFIWSEIKKK